MENGMKRFVVRKESNQWFLQSAEFERWTQCYWKAALFNTEYEASIHAANQEEECTVVAVSVRVDMEVA